MQYPPKARRVGEVGHHPKLVPFLQPCQDRGHIVFHSRILDERVDEASHGVCHDGAFVAQIMVEPLQRLSDSHAEVDFFEGGFGLFVKFVAHVKVDPLELLEGNCDCHIVTLKAF